MPLRRAFFACIILIIPWVMVSCSGHTPTFSEPGAVIETFTNSDTESAAEAFIPPVTSLTQSGNIYSDSNLFVMDEVQVVLKDGILDSPGSAMTPDLMKSGSEFLAGHGLEFMNRIDLSWGTVYKLKVTDGVYITDKVKEIAAIPGVDMVEPNFKVYPQSVPYSPNDPLWELDNDLDDDPRSNAREQFGPAKLGADILWDETRGEGIVVAITDEGFRTSHEDLINTLWVNGDEIPDNEIDDDENGYVDDINGWDFANNDPNLMTADHGTACAGIICAEQDNDKGCTGIAPGARMMGIKFSFLDGNSILFGIDYAVDNGADIISMSWLTYFDSGILKNTMDAAYNAGVILVASAGNDDTNQPGYPAAWDSVICVGASSPFSKPQVLDPIDEIRISNAAGFGWGSNYGPHQELMGFGWDYITVAGGNDKAYYNGQGWSFFGGTSCAAPVVAGSLALIKSYLPELDNVQLRELARETADDLMEPGFEVDTGYGRVNIIRACYGSDRYEGNEDPDGFVDMAAFDNDVLDSLHAVEGDYYDVEDLFKFTADQDGTVSFDLDIYTWGESLDLLVFSDPSIQPEYLRQASAGENHAATSYEGVQLPCTTGETFYVVARTGNYGDSSSYRLTANYVDPRLTVTSGKLNTGFIHVGANNLVVGFIDIDTNSAVHLDRIVLTLTGDMPASKLKECLLFRETRPNGSKDNQDDLFATGKILGTNRVLFDGFNHNLTPLLGTTRLWVQVDLGGITGDADFSFELRTYKDVDTQEMVTAPYADFPQVIGPFNVGVDITPPTWNSTVGVQEANPRYASAIIYWNNASDSQTPPIDYNVYWSDSLPFEFSTAMVEEDVSKWNASGYDSGYTVHGLENGKEHYIVLRAQDQAGNEEDNLEIISVTPSDESLPGSPQLVGTFDSDNDSWEVLADGANQRVFVADAAGGLLILDVSNPLDPQLVDSVSSGSVYGLAYDGTYIYAAGSPGLLIVDPDDPSGATIIGTANLSNPLDVTVAGNWAYVSNFSTSMLPVDIADKQNPAAYPVVQTGYRGYGIESYEDHLYLATADGPEVYSLSDPSQPVKVGDFFGPVNPYEVHVYDGILFVTYWDAKKFVMYELTDPESPEFIGEWVSNSGNSGSDVVLFNGYAYFGTNSWGIEVLDISDPANITEVGQIQTNGPDGMSTEGSFVYSAENEHGVKIII
jgi:hypothetical protein